MKFLAKIINFFLKTKKAILTVREKVDSFIKAHRKQIKVLMSILEVLFPAGTGAKKMACVVSNICYAIGYEAAEEDIVAYVEEKCQEVYDEFKASLDAEEPQA